MLQYCHSRITLKYFIGIKKSIKVLQSKGKKGINIF
jgi:hypothetical protein